MSKTLIIKRDMVGARITDILTEGEGLNQAVFDLTDCTVRFLLEQPDDTLLDRSGVIEGDPTTGQVSYTTVAADLTALGNNRQEWEVTKLDGTKLYFPSDGHNIIKIIAGTRAAV